MMPIISVLAYLLLAPLVGILLDGWIAVSVPGCRAVRARRCCSLFMT